MAKWEIGEKVVLKGTGETVTILHKNPGTVYVQYNNGEKITWNYRDIEKLKN